MEAIRWIGSAGPVALWAVASLALWEAAKTEGSERGVSVAVSVSLAAIGVANAIAVWVR